MEGGVGVGDCVGVIVKVGEGAGVTVNVGEGVGVILNFGAGAVLTGVSERNTTTGEESLAGLAAAWGAISDNLLSPVPASLHPPRKIIRANTNKYARCFKNLSSFNII